MAKDLCFIKIVFKIRNKKLDIVYKDLKVK